MKSVSEFDSMDPALVEAPHAFYESLRETAPVHHDSKLDSFLVSRYADVKAILSNPTDNSSMIGPITTVPPMEALTVMAQGMPPVNTLLTADPPEHIRYRSLVSRAFAPQRVARLEPLIRCLREGLVDGFVADGAGAFTELYAVPVPLTMIADQLGVARSDLSNIKKWSDQNSGRTTCPQFRTKRQS